MNSVPVLYAFCFPNQIVSQIYDLLILSTEGFHRGTIWLKVDNLAALSTNLPTLCQKICHENALYWPQIWVIRHWTTPMGRGSDWAISSAKNQRPVSDIQHCKLFSNIILSRNPTCLLCYQNKQWFPDYLAGTSRLGGVCVITGRSAIRGHGVGHYRSSECGGEAEKVESHPFGVSQVSCCALLVLYGACSEPCLAEKDDLKVQAERPTHLWFVTFKGSLWDFSRSLMVYCFCGLIRRTSIK